MRRKVLGVLVLMCVALLVACGGTSDEENEGNGNNQGEAAEDNDEKEWYEREGKTDQQKVRYKTAQMIIDETGLETNLPEELSDMFENDKVMEDGSLLRFASGSKSVDVRMNKKDEGGDGTMFVDISLYADIGETYEDTNVRLLEDSQSIIDYMYQEVLPETDMDELSLELSWQYPSKHGADDEYSFNNGVIEMGTENYETFWEDRETDDLEARLADFEGASLNEGHARPVVVSDHINDDVIPLIGNLDRHDPLGEYIDLNGIEVKVDKIEATDSMEGQKAGEGEYKDSSKFMAYEVSIKNNRDYKLRIRIPSTLEVSKSWKDDGVGNEKIVVEDGQKEGLLGPGKEHTFKVFSTYEDDADHIGFSISASSVNAYDGEKGLLDDVPVATWSIEDVLE